MTVAVGARFGCHLARSRWQLERFAELQAELSESIAEAIEGGAAMRSGTAAREVQLLAGRSYEQPLASLRRGTLTLEDTPDALCKVRGRHPPGDKLRDRPTGGHGLRRGGLRR